MSGYEKLVAGLEERGLLVPSWGDQVRAKCPAHDDNVASLSVAEGDHGVPLFYCFAGCDWKDVLDALGLTWESLSDSSRPAEGRIVARYTYTDAEGNPVQRKVRREPKDFYQEFLVGGEWQLRRPPGFEPLLYNLPAVLKAVKDDTPVYIVEGEKDVHTIQATQTGVVATTTGAALLWSKGCTDALRGARVVIIPDRDEPGRKHAAIVAGACAGVARLVEVRWPQGDCKDATDHIFAGYSLDELAMVEPGTEDWDSWEGDVEPTAWAVEGIIARGTLVWAYGPTETAKSMALMGIATDLTHQGEFVAYYGEEMDVRTERDRIKRFGPDPRYFRWKNGRGLDLNNEEHIAQIVRENQGTVLIILDSYERVWGNVRANENRRAVEFARAAHEIILGTGAAVVVIDHTGFGYRDSDGNVHEQTEPRGASAKRQQADTAILFSSRGTWMGPGHDYYFHMKNMKAGRIGNPFDINMRVTDTPSGGLAIVREDLQNLGRDANGQPKTNGTRPSADTSLPVGGVEPDGAPLAPSPKLTMREKIAMSKMTEAEQVAYTTPMSEEDAMKAVASW